MQSNSAIFNIYICGHRLFHINDQSQSSEISTA